jgi:hypothetical protein
MAQSADHRYPGWLSEVIREVHEDLLTADSRSVRALGCNFSVSATSLRKPVLLFGLWVAL